MQLRWLGDAVVILVLPKPKRGEYRVSAIDYSVAISAVCGLVILSQRQKTVSFDSRWRLRLRCKVAEQLRAVIDCAVAIAIECQPRLIAIRVSPGQMFATTIAIHVKEYAVSGTGKSEAVARDVYDYRTRRRIGVTAK